MSNRLKVLFVTSAAGIDYMSDCLFHGLVTLQDELGIEVTDSKYLWYLSKPIDKEARLKLYGKGFTLSGLLPDRHSIDRSRLSQRIEDGEFGLVIYGSCCRSLDYINEVLATCPRSKTVFVNGEDDACVHPQLLSRGLYFKRELVGNIAHPLSFAIPEEKIVSSIDISKKTKLKSFIDPRDKSTYIYSDEQPYYEDYQTSFYGFTCKKAGWDCLRHYEILANGCLPYFVDYARCPKFTMANWPTSLQCKANRLVEQHILTGSSKELWIDEYADLLQKMLDYCKQNLTTKCLARHVLKVAGIR